MSDGFLAPLVAAAGAVFALGLATNAAVILDEEKEVKVSIVTEAVIINLLASHKWQGPKKKGIHKAPLHLLG
jgi:hypothetical protein